MNQEIQNPMKTAHAKSKQKAAVSKAHSTPSWSKNMTVRKGRFRGVGGPAIKGADVILRGGTPHLG
jgi:hypothetical protein